MCILSIYEENVYLHSLCIRQPRFGDRFRTIFLRQHSKSLPIEHIQNSFTERNNGQDFCICVTITTVGDGWELGAF